MKMGITERQTTELSGLQQRYLSELGKFGMDISPESSTYRSMERLFLEVIPVKGESVVEHALEMARKIGSYDSEHRDIGALMEFVGSVPDVYNLLSHPYVERWVNAGILVMERAQKEMVLDYDISDQDAGESLVKSLKEAENYFSRADFSSIGTINSLRKIEEENRRVEEENRRVEEETRKRDYLSSLNRISRQSSRRGLYALFMAGVAATSLALHMFSSDKISNSSGNKIVDSSSQRLSALASENDMNGLHNLIDELNLNYGEPYKSPEGPAMAFASHQSDCQRAAEWYTNILLGLAGARDVPDDTRRWVEQESALLCADVPADAPAIVFYTTVPAAENNGAGN